MDGPFLHQNAPKTAFDCERTGTFTGPLDPPGSRAEKAGAAAQRLSMRLRDRLRR